MNQVGYLANRNEVTLFMSKLATELLTYNLELVIFTAEQVDFDKEKVDGLIYKDNEWKEVRLPIPFFIDVEPSVFQKSSRRSILKELRNYSELSITARYPLPRSRYPKYFKKGTYFYEKMIFRQKITSSIDLQEELKKHRVVCLTPIGSSNRQFIIDQTGNEMNVYDAKNHSIMLKNSFLSYLEGKGCWVERLVPSILGPLIEVGGYAHLEKGSQGEWTLLSIVLNDGKTLREYFKEHYPNDHTDLYRTANNELYHFSKMIELIRKRNFVTLCIHFNVGREGELNFGKVTQVVKNQEDINQVVALRAAYYSYVSSLLSSLNIEDERRGRNKDIEKELFQLEAEEERKRELIEQGLMKEEKKRWTGFNILILIAIFFAILRYLMRVFI